MTAEKKLIVVCAVIKNLKKILFIISKVKIPKSKWKILKTVRGQGNEKYNKMY